MHRLFFVTGASGAGKTTAIKELETRRSDIVFRYFDTIGVPPREKVGEKYGSGEEWQRQMTIEWLRRIKADALLKAPVVLDGQTRQSYIEEACAAAAISEYEIILFDCEDAERDRRVVARGHPELVNSRMTN